MNITANVTLTLSIKVRNDTWTQHSTSEQLLREASDLAVKTIRENIERYATIVGKPVVDAVITSSEPRR